MADFHKNEERWNLQYWYKLVSSDRGILGLTYRCHTHRLNRVFADKDLISKQLGSVPNNIEVQLLSNPDIKYKHGVGTTTLSVGIPDIKEFETAIKYYFERREIS